MVLLFLPHIMGPLCALSYCSPHLSPNCITSSITSRQLHPLSLSTHQIVFLEKSWPSGTYPSVTVHLHIPSPKIFVIWRLISYGGRKGFAPGQMTVEVIKQIRGWFWDHVFYPASSLLQPGNKPCFLLTREGYYPIGELGRGPLESP